MMAEEMHWRSENFFLHLSLIGFVGLLVLQLIPWPQLMLLGCKSEGPNLPHLASGASLAGCGYGFSTTPSASWAAATSVIPFFALFFGVSQQDEKSRFKLASVLIGMGTLALLVGFIQVLQGSNSDLRFFKITNPSEAVGFFANRNHFAAQLYTTLILAAIWLAFSTDQFVKAGAVNARAILWFALSAILVISVLAGLALARSRAGLLLSVAALAGIAVIFFVSFRTSKHVKHRAVASPMVKSRRPLAGQYKHERTNKHSLRLKDNTTTTRRRRRGQREHLIRRLALITLVFAVIFALQFGFQRVMPRFDDDPLNDLRLALSPKTLELAVQNLPFGTGLGSFVEIYAAHERTQDLFTGYANRAHNDWAEFFLETGILGAIVGCLFFAWFVRRTLQVWFSTSKQDVDYHLMLQRGASLLIVLLLAHSLVDYPLRTTAISAIFAFGAAVLATPPKVLRGPNLQNH